MNKEEAIEILSEMRSEYNLFGDEEEATRYHVLSWAIKEMNTEPVRHGRWIMEFDEISQRTDWHCSVCGKHGRGDYKRCPWCGAKMDLPEPIIYPQVEGITPTVINVDEVEE